MGNLSSDKGLSMPEFHIDIFAVYVLSNLSCFLFSGGEGCGGWFDSSNSFGYGEFLNKLYDLTRLSSNFPTKIFIYDCYDHSYWLNH